MTNLYISEAIAFVRARLDEIAQSDSDMIVNEVDDRNLNETVERLLPEAVEEVHAIAPASLLEGQTFSTNDTHFTKSLSDGVLDVDFRSPTSGTTPFKGLRLVWFKCSDGILTSAEYPEDSPEGRIQLNKYIQGQPDEPVVIRQADSNDGLLHYKYYTTKATAENLAFDLSVFPYPEINQNSGNPYIIVSIQLKTQTLNRLVYRVLLAYGDAQRAQAYAKQA